MKNNERTLEFIRKYMSVSGIYAIKCTVNNKRYVGSSVKIGRELGGYFSSLRNQRHRNSELQRDFNEFGQDSFECEILEVTKPEDNLLAIEHQWIKEIKYVYNAYKEFTKITFENSDKFWETVNIANENECWLSKLSIGSGGYVHLRYNGKTLAAHRVAYFISNKDHDQNQIIRHTCSNKKCCNPSHLQSGSHQDNCRDKIENREINLKGNMEIAIAIRNKAKDNPELTSTELIEWINDKFNQRFSQSYISSILLNRIWVDLNFSPMIDRYNSEYHPCTKLTWDMVRWVRKIYQGDEKINKTEVFKLFEAKYGHGLVSLTGFMLMLANKTFIDNLYIPPNKEYRLSGEDCASILNWSIVNKIRELGNEGMSSPKIRDTIHNLYNLELEGRYIREILNNEVWRDEEYTYNKSNRKYQFWTDDEKNKLRELRSTHTIAELVKIMGKSDKAISRQCQKMGINVRDKITPEIKEFIILLHRESVKNIQISKLIKSRFNVTISSTWVSIIIKNSYNKGE